MNHPDISTYNANLYLVKMIHDAEEYRQAEKLTPQLTERNLLGWLKKLPTLTAETLKKPATPTA